MIIAVCDPKGIAIEAIKTILYHDKGLSDRISRIYEFWNMEQLLDASRDSSFDCIVFPNYCNSHNSVVCSLSCGYNRFPLDAVLEGNSWQGGKSKESHQRDTGGLRKGRT